MKSLYYWGPSFRGHPTQVYAYYAAPAGQPPAGGWPAVVCAHGGGGTAFPEWVRRWNAQGFAALAMDLVGGLPEADKPAANRSRHVNSGPNHIGGAFPDITAPLKDQWMYHAVADLMLAHSLLRSFPEINPHQIGLIGVSWGGVLACTVAGLDQRYRFVIPVYGCGYLAEGQSGFAEPIRKGASAESLALVKTVWDPSNYLPQATMPMLWLNDSDPYFPFDVWMSSIRLVKAPVTLRIDLKMGHGHPEAWSVQEAYRFARSQIGAGEPLAKLDEPRLGQRVVSTSYICSLPAARAEFVYTLDSGPWTKRQWQHIPAGVEAKTLSAVLPAQPIRAGYFNLTDQNSAITSSGVVGTDTHLETKVR